MAFDRVSHEWVQMILTKYGFGEKFQNWINILYTCARSTNFTNGFFSKTINIERGVRQGSPLGPYLDILQCEPLESKVREDENIKGIIICDKNRKKIGEVKITLFADDTQCYISDLKSVEIWFQHLHTYERASGAVVNFNKSYGLLLGIFFSGLKKRSQLLG